MMATTEAEIARKGIGCAGAVITLLVTLPAWLYLVHFMLTATGAGRAEWVIYWMYVPASLVAASMHIWGSRPSSNN